MNLNDTITVTWENEAVRGKVYNTDTYSNAYASVLPGGELEIRRSEQWVIATYHKSRWVHARADGELIRKVLAVETV